MVGGVRLRDGVRIEKEAKRKSERETERDNIPEGVPGGPTKTRRTEEMRRCPLVRPGRWRLGHARQ